MSEILANSLYYGSRLQKSLYVIPVKAGIQSFQCILDPGFYRGDGISWFCNWLIG
jgi:hypothetical protein